MQHTFSSLLGLQDFKNASLHIREREEKEDGEMTEEDENESQTSKVPFLMHLFYIFFRSQTEMFDAFSVSWRDGYTRQVVWGNVCFGTTLANKNGQMWSLE